MKHTEHAYIRAGYQYERAATPNKGQAAAEIIRAMLNAEHHTERTEARRDGAVEGFRKGLDPMRLTLKSQAFLGGNQPNYADYIAFGGFQWARAVSPFALLEHGEAAKLPLARRTNEQRRIHERNVKRV